ncbi:signal peptide peptidase SppA [Pelagibius sp. Alg239-R121]|uniref:signal peptide peptidase SppA n=1 Tax=Pelagibius sp. Alg239-R121 TaxID=2993448 RepID=UPI0024A653AC|nr:signal peptide peptidase SppA [Pelagibius sp. Alg239-R121]
MTAHTTASVNSAAGINDRNRSETMKVILFLLKCVVGLFATLGFALVLVIGFSLSTVRDDIARFDYGPEPLPERIVLQLDLANGVSEASPQSPFGRASQGRGMALRDLVDALSRASSDPRVAGVIARVGRGSLGISQVQELRDAIADFRATGKFSVAFAESFGEGGNGTLHYYLASSFEELWLQPSGDVDITGIRIESPFIRGLLDEYGVKPRIGQREEYKGAAGFLTDRAMSAPVRRNLQQLVDSWLTQIVEGVADTRGLDQDDTRALIDRAPLSAADAKDAGLVSQLGYWDAVLESVLPGEESGSVNIRDYYAALERESSEGPIIALVHGVGAIALAESDDGAFGSSEIMGSDTIADALSTAIDDPNVAAIVFRVDSPGGSYVASDTIWREVVRAREAGKPVIVSMGGLAASGGYFVSAAAERIVANPATITGSIGVVSGKVVLDDLWSGFDIAWDGVQAGRNADIWNGNRDFTSQQWQLLQTSLDRVYADFTQKVAEGRGLPLSQIMTSAKGQVWTGRDAKDLGLVDELGGFATALKLARNAAGLTEGQPHQLKVLPEGSSFEDLIRDMLAGDFSGPGINGLVRSLARFAQVVAPFLEAVESVTADPRSRTLEAPQLRVTQ